MPQLVWDKVGDRLYETGLDKGVLYLPDGSAVPWNGLTSIIEKFDKESSPVYYDGMKINDLVVLGDFSASMKAVTYPDEFVELEGFVSVRNGLFAADQRPQTFGLCYRTLIGNDFDGDTAGYKLHILYNVTAIPSDKTYATASTEPSLVEFEWEITAIPEDIPGIRPTAHLVMDSRDFDPWLLEELETILYGDTDADAALIPMPDLVEFIKEWYRFTIVDNLDGTATITSVRDEAINFLDVDAGLAQLIGIKALEIGDDKIELYDTYDLTDIPQIAIIDNGDGTWTATTEFNNLILVDEEGLFEIRNANAVYLNPTTYQVDSTTGDI